MQNRRGPQSSLSRQVLDWLRQRIPDDDVIRIGKVDQYRDILLLGNGRFGEVHKYLDTRTMVHETCKVVKIEMFDHWSQDAKRVSHRLNVFLEEFRRLHEISFANERIANFIGIFADTSRMLVFTEYLPNGSVKDRLQKDNITEETAVKYFCDTLEALDYLHNLDPPIIHRDIKAANLLITISDSVKLGNFGLVRDLAVDGFGLAVASEISLDFRGTLLYVAPEVFTSELGPGNRKAYGLPADIWALGCTFIEMLCRFPPYFEYFGQVDQVHSEIVERAAGSQAQWLPYSADVLVPSSSEFVRRLIDSIFVRDPERRPSTAALKDLVVVGPVSSPISSPPSSPIELAHCEPSTSNRFPLFPVRNDLKEVEEEEEEEDEEQSDNETIPAYRPMETLEDGAMRRRRTIHSKKRKKAGTMDSLKAAVLHHLSRLMFFLSILSKSVLYVLAFIIMGLGTLGFFLFIAYCIVLFFRYLIKLNCECDLAQPQYLIISGILLILLFALLFSCCMVALGEYKFRMANRTLRESRFFVKRPSNDIVMCGVTVLSSKRPASPSLEDDDVMSNQKEEDFEMKPHSPSEENANDSFYYR